MYNPAKLILELYKENINVIKEWKIISNKYADEISKLLNEDWKEKDMFYIRTSFPLSSDFFTETEFCEFLWNGKNGWFLDSKEENKISISFAGVVSRSAFTMKKL